MSPGASPAADDHGYPFRTDEPGPGLFEVSTFSMDGQTVTVDVVGRLYGARATELATRDGSRWAAWLTGFPSITAVPRGQASDYDRGVMDTSHAALPLWARLLLFVGLVVVAAYALPVSAAAVEAFSARAENWILVVYVALVALVGGGVGALAPRSSTARTRRGRVLRWAGAGLLAAFIGYSVWLRLLAG